MTAQTHDVLFYEELQFSITGIQGSGLFEPEHHGFEPIAICSSSHRGFDCVYTVANKQLYLNRLTIGVGYLDGLRARHRGEKALFGTTPQGFSRGGVCTLVYDQFQEPISFTGGLLIGRDLIRALFVNMGFQATYKHEKVYELLFENGQVKGCFDLSDEMADVRERLSRRSLIPDSVDDIEEVFSWINDCFQLDYR